MSQSATPHPTPLQLFLSSLAAISNYIHNIQPQWLSHPHSLTNPINYMQMPPCLCHKRATKHVRKIPCPCDLLCLSVRPSVCLPPYLTFMELSETRGECCMCGDYGLSEELFQCKVCRFRSQHRSVKNSSTNL